jgi:hypothetical protein
VPLILYFEIEGINIPIPINIQKQNELAEIIAFQPRQEEKEGQNNGMKLLLNSLYKWSSVLRSMIQIFEMFDITMVIWFPRNSLRKILTKKDEQVIYFKKSLRKMARKRKFSASENSKRKKQALLLDPNARWDCLIPVLQANILGYLELDDWARLSTVCKQWNELGK